MLGSFSNQTDPFELSLQRDKKEGAVRVNPSFESVLNDVLRFFLYEMFFGDLTFFRRWNFYGSDGVRIRLRCLAELIKCSYFVFEGFLARCFVLT